MVAAQKFNCSLLKGIKQPSHKRDKYGDRNAILWCVKCSTMSVYHPGYPITTPKYRTGLWVLLGVVLAGFLYLWRACLVQTGGKFVYGLDDAYIHLAIAKNLMSHGVWGVTPFGNTSASSSPLWTLLLAGALKLTAGSVFTPLIVAATFSALATLYLYRQFAEFEVPIPIAVLVSALFYLVVPLTTLPFIGMEHAMQVFWVVLYAFWLIRRFHPEAKDEHAFPVAFLTLLMCLTRFECAFLVIVPFLVALWRRDIRLACSLALGPMVAIGGFAFYSFQRGMPLVPNSILLKGNHPGDPAYLQSILMHIRFGLYSDWPSFTDLFLLTLTCAGVLRLKALREANGPLQVLVWTTLVATVLHAGFAIIGGMFRYEAYLVALMAICIGLTWWEAVKAISQIQDRTLTRQQWFVGFAAILIGILLLIPVFIFLKHWALVCTLEAWLLTLALIGLRQDLTTQRFAKLAIKGFAPVMVVIAMGHRSLESARVLPFASRDIYSQQLQMATFLHRYYPGSKVVANDIGAICFLDDPHLLDLFGLATDKVAHYRMKGSYGTKEIGSLIHDFDPDVAVLYPSWFSGNKALPPTMLPVAAWTGPPVVSAASPTVVFFANSRPKALALRKRLMEFRPSLPEIVRAKFYRLPGE